MRKAPWYIFGVCCCAAVLIGQDLPRTFPAPNGHGYGYLNLPRNERVRRTSRVRGVEYESSLQPPAQSSEWGSSAPLPISLSMAEKLAREELAKIVDEDDWIATDFQISRFAAAPSWYYSVTLKPALQLSGEQPESFTFLIDLSGRPGRVRNIGHHQIER